jgi:protein O-mannosyl-transferase
MESFSNYALKKEKQGTKAMKFFDLGSETNLSPCRRNVFAIASIFIIIFIIYSNTFDASWHFDDEYNILKNDALQLKELNWQNIKKTFHANWNGRGNIYRPAACFTLALNYYFGGNEVYGYHMVNLFIHFLSSVFLFLFIYNTLNLPILKKTYEPQAFSIALLATVFWAINPVQTQAVTYIIQRMSAMAGMFYIMSLYFYLKGRTSASKILKNIQYLLFFTCGMLAVFSKENAAILPLVILLYDLFLIKGILKKNIKRYFFLLLIAILVILSLALMTAGPSVFMPKNILGGYQIRGFTLIERLLTEPRIVLFYASLLLYPMPYRLCFSHDIAISRGMFDPPMTIISILLVFFIIGLALFKSKNWPLFSFCILFFFLNHVIESTIFPLELVFEHRNYIPSMLFFLPIAILIAKGIKGFSYKKSMQFIIAAFTVLAIVATGHATFIRNFAWKSEGSLWLDAVEKYPKLSRPHLNLGRFFTVIGLKESALEQFKMALELPDGPNRKEHFLVHYNMGLIYKSLKDRDRAQKHFLKALELEPRYPPAFTNLGILEMERGAHEKALQYFLRALTHEINSQQERNYAGLVLLRQNKFEDAITQFQKSLKANPSDQAYILAHLGAAYKGKGELESALKCFKKVIRKNHRYVPAYLHLIEAYLLKGEATKAEKTAEELIGLFPDNKMSLLVDKMIIHGDILMELPDIKSIAPTLEKVIIKKGNHYHELARKLEKYRDQEFAP